MVHIKDTRIILVRAECPYVQFELFVLLASICRRGVQRIERGVGPQVSVGVFLSMRLVNRCACCALLSRCFSFSMMPIAKDLSFPFIAQGNEVDYNRGRAKEGMIGFFLPGHQPL